MVLLVYVDDILITGPSLAAIREVKDFFHTLFMIKDIGDAHYFLGLEIARLSVGLYVLKTKYTMDITRDVGLCQAKSTPTPLPQGLRLHFASDDPLPNPDSYYRLVDRLVYLGFTRPDNSHSIQQLSQFLTNPCKSHWFAALHLNSLVLKAYCDAYCGTDPDSRLSLIGFCTFLGSALVSWKTKKQPTVSRSTVEAEHCSLAATVCKLRWLSYILTDLGVSTSLPIELFCDNKATLHILANPIFHERRKHIELDCYLVRDAYKEGFVAPSFIQSLL
ncbi:uncharacterized protein LOC110012096 [Sesamum indicum]|uniref:Uncharacterized protein LOC110012096 n=1 Tax=Sesamum indicum TaxID=4182 RepID=A0A8M8V0R6_SESIN|nr:uncharacterized protein LOC110012096 [Sesamum indicum]